MRSRPFSLVGICLFLAVFYEITGGGESSRYGESIAALLMMARPKKKPSVQQAAGRALHAMGDAVEHFPGSLKM